MSTLISLLISLVLSVMMEVPAEEIPEPNAENHTIQLQQKSAEGCNEE